VFKIKDIINADARRNLQMKAADADQLASYRNNLATTVRDTLIAQMPFLEQWRDELHAQPNSLDVNGTPFYRFVWRPLNAMSDAVNVTATTRSSKNAKLCSSLVDQWSQLHESISSSAVPAVDKEDTYIHAYTPRWVCVCGVHGCVCVCVGVGVCVWVCVCVCVGCMCVCVCACVVCVGVCVCWWVGGCVWVCVCGCVWVACVCVGVCVGVCVWVGVGVCVCVCVSVCVCVCACLCVCV